MLMAMDLRCDYLVLYQAGVEYVLWKLWTAHFQHNLEPGETPPSVNIPVI